MRKGYKPILVEATEAREIFNNTRALLKERGRLIFALRYRDNVFTWRIDALGLPLYAAFKNFTATLRRKSGRYKLKFHGYRRSKSEIVAMAQKAGYRFGRAYQMLRRLDARLGWLNNIVIFEFLT